jgi:hypothetical protein
LSPVRLPYTYTVSDPRFEVLNDVLQLMPGRSLPISTSPMSVQVTSTAANGLSVTDSFNLYTSISQTATPTPTPTSTPASPVIIGAEPVFKRKLNKKGKPTLKPVLVGYAFEFSSPLNSSGAGNAANYHEDTVTTKRVEKKNGKTKGVRSRCLV